MGEVLPFLPRSNTVRRAPLAAIARTLRCMVRDRMANGEWSVYQLARITGISQPHLQHWLRGQRQLSPGAQDTVVRRLGIEPAALFARALAADGDDLPAAA